MSTTEKEQFCCKLDDTEIPARIDRHVSSCPKWADRCPHGTCMAGITYWNLVDGTAYAPENSAQGGLLDKDLNPKASYRELDRLINHEWKTSLAAKTDATGKATFRGFYGKYVVKVRSATATQEFTIDLKKDGPRAHKLIPSSPVDITARTSE